MSSRWIVPMVAMAVVAGAVGPAMAATAPAAPAPAAPAVAPPAAEERAACNCIFCQAKEQMKQATPWLKLFADARLREVFTPNLLLDREDRHFQRYRFRLGATVTPVENLDFNFRMVYEPRHFCQPARQAFTRDAAYIDEWTMSEAIIDRLNVTWNKPLGLPVKAVVGRQDIILGDGWLVLDGTPLDGSRTIFFDAARLTWNFDAAKTTVDTIYIDQHADSDRWLTPACDKDFHNIEQDERGVIVWVTNKSLPQTEVNPYFIYKQDDAILGTRSGDGVAPWQAGTDAKIYTFGTRVVHDLTENINLRGEIAGQFGRKNGRDLCAMGARTQAMYKFNDPCKNEFHAGYEFLSGDQSGSGNRDEQFDPLWGRWPQWSELYVYTVALENRPGETTNLHRIGLGWSSVPSDKVTLQADYHVLFANHNSYDNFGRVTSADPTKRYFTDDGNCRGQLLVGQLIYQFTPHISGHLRAELFFPGNFYNDERNETAGFFRYELTMTW